MIARNPSSNPTIRKYQLNPIIRKQSKENPTIRKFSKEKINPVIRKITIFENISIFEWVGRP
jgi:hypothetical protein